MRVFSRQNKKKSSAARHFTIVPRAPHVKHARHFVVFCLSFCFYHTHAHTSLARHTYAHTYTRMLLRFRRFYVHKRNKKETSMTRSRHGTQRRVRIGGIVALLCYFLFQPLLGELSLYHVNKHQFIYLVYVLSWNVVHGKHGAKKQKQKTHETKHVNM